VGRERRVMLTSELPLPCGSKYVNQTTLRGPMEFFPGVLSIANKDRRISKAFWEN
jgi:hypothetical protein